MCVCERERESEVVCVCGVWCAYIMMEKLARKLASNSEYNVVTNTRTYISTMSTGRACVLRLLHVKQLSTVTTNSQWIQNCAHTHEQT